MTDKFDRKKTIIMNNQKGVDMKKAMLVAVAALSFLTINARAESVLLDTERLHECGGWAELKESLNGDLSVAISNTACRKVRH